MKTVFCLAVFSIAACSCSSAFASAISGSLDPTVADRPRAGNFTLGTTNATNSPVNGRLDSHSVPGATIGQTTAIAANLAVTVFAKHVPFDIDFNMNNLAFLEPGITGRVYDFTVTLTNMIGSGLGNSNPADAGDTIGPFNIELVGDNTTIRFLNGTQTTDGVNALGAAPGGYFGYVNDRKLTFGGLNGAGVQIPNGGSQAFTFSLYAPHSSNSFSLRFTANPEPGALALAALAMIPCGVVVRRRRRAAVESKA